MLLKRDLFSVCMDELLLFPKLCLGSFFFYLNVLQYFLNEMNTAAGVGASVPITYSQAWLRCLKRKQIVRVGMGVKHPVSNTRLLTERRSRSSVLPLHHSLQPLTTSDPLPQLRGSHRVTSEYCFPHILHHFPFSFCCTFTSLSKSLKMVLVARACRAFIGKRALKSCFLFFSDARQYNKLKGKLEQVSSWREAFS